MKKNFSLQNKNAIDTDKILMLYSVAHGVLANLVIALACHAGDHGFESRTSRCTVRYERYFFYSGNSAAGSALASGVRGPGFESRLPDTFSFQKKSNNVFTATKIETEVLKILNQIEFLEKEQIIEEICQNREKNSAQTPLIIENALEGCITKGFAAPTGDGKFKITEEGKKQI